MRVAARGAQPVDAERQRGDPGVLGDEAAAVEAGVGVALEVARQRGDQLGELVLAAGGAAQGEVDADVVDARGAGEPQFGVELGRFAFLLVGLLGDQLAVALAAAQVRPQPLAAAAGARAAGGRGRRR